MKKTIVDMTGWTKAQVAADFKARRTVGNKLYEYATPSRKDVKGMAAWTVGKELWAAGEPITVAEAMDRKAMDGAWRRQGWLAAYTDSIQ